MRIRCFIRSGSRSGVAAAALAALVSLAVAVEVAQARRPDTAAARSSLKKALDKGDLDAVRVSWTIWPTREMWQTVEVRRGQVARHGGVKANARSERALGAEERQQLLAALKAARADQLVWVDRDVKSDGDRVLNLDIVKPDGSLVSAGAFVRTMAMWRTGATKPLATLLEKWLAPDATR